MAELDDLHGRIEKLERIRPVPQRLNPFEDIAFQLALESGHTVSARTRRLVMANRGMNTNSGVDMDFPDAVDSFSVVHIPVPNDWVVGTGITVNIMLLQTSLGGAQLAVLNSDIGVEKDGDTFSDNNVQNNVSIDTTFIQNIVKVISITLPGGGIEANDKIQWQIKRTGGHGNDTVNGPLRFRSAWIEYTAFF